MIRGVRNRIALPMITASVLRNFAPTAILWAVLYSPVVFGQPSQLERLEAQLKTQPDSIDIRVSLVREYFRVSGQDGSAEQSRVAHLLWLIEYYSEIPVLGEPVATIGHFECARERYFREAEEEELVLMVRFIRAGKPLAAALRTQTGAICGSRKLKRFFGHRRIDCAEPIAQ